MRPDLYDEQRGDIVAKRSDTILDRILTKDDILSTAGAEIHKVLIGAIHDELQAEIKTLYTALVEIAVLFPDKPCGRVANQVIDKLYPQEQAE